MANLNLVFFLTAATLQEAKKKVEAGDLEGAQRDMATLAACVANVANRIGNLQG